MSKFRRDISAADQHLWRHVTRNVKPYRPSLHATAAPKTLECYKPSSSLLSTGVSAHGVRAPTAPASSEHNVIRVGSTLNVDHRTGKKLKRGQLRVEGHIDLHGCTLEQAYAELTSFLKRAYNRQARCVLVITGKGRAGNRVGKIRGELPHWLNQPTLRPLILAITEAKIRDGGAGAFYVLLKRNRFEGLR
ncbi:MAG: hypothetical protein CMG46_08970 [Candidatus Marinimicrobia bacterium]|nr:hypothetical protein [Candidatus Neomarinimicrobiota bacterium]